MTIKRILTLVVCFYGMFRCIIVDREGPLTPSIAGAHGRNSSFDGLGAIKSKRTVRFQISLDGLLKQTFSYEKIARKWFWHCTASKSYVRR